MSANSSVRDAFEPYIQELSQLKEEVEHATLVSTGKVAFGEAVTCLIDELLREIDNLAIDLERAGRTRGRIEAARRALDLFSHSVRRILEANISVELDYFLDQVIDDLKLDIPIVLMPSSFLGSRNVVARLRTILSMLEFPISLKDKSIWVIYTPQALIRNPIYWPLILHEIGHCMEESLKIVQRFYPLTGFEEPGSIQSVTHSYSVEYQADTIAALYIGPVYVRKIFESYFYEEVTVSPSHPVWPERFKVMLNEVYKGIDDFKDIEDKLGELGRALIAADRLEHLPAILDKAGRLLDERGMRFVPETNVIERVKRKLIAFKPYTEDIRVLLNAAYLANSEAVSTFIEEKLERTPRPDENTGTLKTVAQNEFQDLIRDCVRLTRMRKLFVKRARTQS